MSDAPIYVDNGKLKLAQTCWVKEVTQPTTISRTDFSDGQGGNFAVDGVSIGQQTVDIKYNLDVDDITAYWRGVETNGDAFLDPVIDNTTYNGGTVSDTLGWSSASLSGNATLSGSTELEFETDTLNNGAADVDIVAFVDDRFTYTFDNSVHQNDGYLDGPELYPDSQEAVLNEVTRTQRIREASVTSSWGDTTNNQYVEVQIGSNTAERNDNSTSVTQSVSDPDAEKSVQARFGLSRYPVNTNPQSATPRFGYNGQEVDSYSLNIDPLSIQANDIGENEVEAIVEPNQINGTRLEEAGQLSGSTLLTHTIFSQFDVQPDQEIRSSEKIEYDNE